MKNKESISFKDLVHNVSEGHKKDKEILPMANLIMDYFIKATDKNSYLAGIDWSYFIHPRDLANYLYANGYRMKKGNLSKEAQKAKDSVLC